MTDLDYLPPRPSRLAADLKCTLKPHMEAKLPEPETPEAALKGSLIHAIGEFYNRQAFEESTKNVGKHLHAERLPESITSDPLFDETCIELADEAFEQTKPMLEKALESRGEVHFEKLLYMPADYAPAMQGSIDCLAVSNDSLYIGDYKFGHVKVFAKDNPQLLAYALMAHAEYHLFYSFETIKVAIIQPTLDHVDEWDIESDHVLQWGKHVLAPKIKEIISKTGDFGVGEHCKYCRAAAVCTARAEHFTKMTQLDFVEPQLLSNEQIAEILIKIPLLKQWCDDLNRYALNEAINNGRKLHNLKLVQGNTKRKYKDESEVIDALKTQGYADEDIFEQKLKNMTNMKKMLGVRKFGELVEPLLIKPEGKPQLVSIEDSRSEYSPSSAVLEDFK